MSLPVPMLVFKMDQGVLNRVLERSMTYFLPLTVGQWMAELYPDGAGDLVFVCGTSPDLLGSTPAMYLAQLFMPSPDGQALETDNRLLVVPNQRSRQESGMPSL